MLITTPVRLLALLSAVFLVILIFTPSAGARTWNINTSGTGDAPTIQAAIDSAGTGDEIVVAPETYTWAGQGHLHPGA